MFHPDPRKSHCLIYRKIHVLLTGDMTKYLIFLNPWCYLIYFTSFIFAVFYSLFLVFSSLFIVPSGNYNQPFVKGRKKFVIKFIHAGINSGSQNINCHNPDIFLMEHFLLRIPVFLWQAGKPVHILCKSSFFIRNYVFQYRKIYECAVHNSSLSIQKWAFCTPGMKSEQQEGFICSFL